MGGLLGAEGAAHRKWRAILAPFFTRQAATWLRPRIQARADELLDRVAERGSMDLARDFASPFTAAVILEVPAVPAAMRDKMLAGAPQAFLGFRLIQWGAHTTMSAACRTDGDTLARRMPAGAGQLQVIRVIAEIIAAGHGPPTTLIVQGLLALLDHSDQLAELRADQKSMSDAVEEFLRYCTPFGTEPGRTALEPFELGGCPISRGDMLVVQLGCANRDPAVVDHPGALDINRRPGGHVSFGGGVDQCPGPWLARVEAEVAFETLLRRLPALKARRSARQCEVWRLPSSQDRHLAGGVVKCDSAIGVRSLRPAGQ